MTDKTSEVIMTASTGRVWRRNQCVRQQHQRGEANHSTRLCFPPPASLSRQHFAAIISHLLRAESWKMWLVLTGVATDVFVCIQTCGVWLWWPANSDAPSSVVGLNPTQVPRSELCPCLMFKRSQTEKCQWEKVIEKQWKRWTRK